jgi:hypothetical protein
MNDRIPLPDPKAVAEARWAVAELKNALMSLSIELSDVRKALERTLTDAPSSTPVERAAPAPTVVPIATRIYPAPAALPARKATPRTSPVQLKPNVRQVPAVRVELSPR